MNIAARAAVIAGAFLACSFVASAPPPVLASVAEPVTTPEAPAEPAATPVKTVLDTLPPAAARPKFPASEQLSVDLFEYVNRYVNLNMLYISDEAQYGVSERWVMNPESGMGDCEDFALTKLSILQQAGFPYVTSARITTLLVVTPDGAITGHAVLEIRLPSGAVAVLDNNFNTLMTREELTQNHGYRFYDW